MYTLLGFTTFWEKNPANAFHADSLGVYTSARNKMLGLCTIDEDHLKCDATDGSVIFVLKQPLLYILVLDKLPGYIAFCEPETIQN